MSSRPSVPTTTARPIPPVPSAHEDRSPSTPPYYLGRSAAAWKDALDRTRPMTSVAA
jgi:hypothetical protein